MFVKDSNVEEKGDESVLIAEYYKRNINAE